MIKKSLLTLLLFIVLLLISVAAGAYWILATTSGTGWLLKTVQTVEPRLSVTHIRGVLGNDLTVKDIHWGDGEMAVHVDDAQLVWRPTCLIQLQLCVDKLHLTTVRLQLPPSEEDTAPAEPGPIELPALSLPVSVSLGDIQIHDVELTTTGEPITLQALSLSASAQENTLTIQQLRLEHPQAQASLAGTVTLSDGYPVDMTLTLDLPEILQGKSLRNQTRLSQRIQNLQLDGHISGLYTLDYRANLKPLNPQLPFDLTAHWDNIQPLPDQALTLQQGTLTLQGNLDSYNANLNLHVTGEPAPTADISLTGRGDLEHFELDPLRVATLDGNMVTHGDIRWGQGLSWDIKSALSNINPKPYLPEMPGQIDADLTFAGQPEDYRLDLQVSTALKGLPDSRVQSQITGDLQGITIKALNIATLGGTVRTTGQLNWANVIQWQSKTNFTALNPGQNWPDFDGNLGGRIHTRGRLDNQLELDIPALSIQGTLSGYPTHVEGNIQKKANGEWLIKQFTLDSGDNHVSVAGAIQDSWALTGKVDLNALGVLIPNAQGVLQGHANISGALKSPTIQASFNGKALAFQDYQLDDIVLDADVNALGEKSSRLVLEASGITLAQQHFDTVSVQLNGQHSEHTGSLNITSEQVSTQLDLTGALGQAFNWTGQLQEGWITIPHHRWELQQPVALDWDSQQQRVSIAPHCWNHQSASLCLNDTLQAGQTGTAHLKINQYDLAWLAPWLPENTQPSGQFDADIAAAWKPGTTPQVKVTAQLDRPAITVQQSTTDSEPNVTFQYQTVEITAETQVDKIVSAMTLKSEQIGTGKMNLTLHLQEQQKALSGKINIEAIKLDVLQPFIPAVQQLEGALSANGKISGTLSAPLFNGEIRARDIAFDSELSPLQVEQGNLTARIRGTQLQLDGTWKSGQQPVNVQGKANWSQKQWFADLKLDSEQMLLSLKPQLDAEISPHLTVRIEPQKVKVRGRVHVPYARVVVEELPKSATPVSQDVTIITSEKDSTSAEAQTWVVDAVVQVTLGEDVRLTGLGLKAELSGDLQIKQTPSQPPEANGSIQITQALYKAYGQELTVRNGEIFFAGPFEQGILQMNAVRKVDQVIAGLRISGNVMSPQVTLFSDPVMSEENILAYIVLGRPLGAESTTSEGQLLAQAAVALGILGGKGIANNIAEQLGVKDFQIEAQGSEDDTQVVLSGRLAPNLLVKYGVSVFSPVNTLGIHYDINEKLYVETTQGVESAIDFFYKLEFD